MKPTLLEIVQEVLSAISGDNVNSITDTEGSDQVATIVKSVFKAMTSNRNWPHLKKMIQLSSYADTDYPVYMKLPENVKELVFLKYNAVRSGDTYSKYTDMKWKEPDEFLRLTNQNHSDQSNVVTIHDPSGMDLFIRNDYPPRYFTSFDDSTVIFDAYDSTVDSVLQASKVQAQAYVFPEWVHEDDAIPDLPIEAFASLIEESKSRASLELKQIPNNKAEQESQRQRSWLSRKDWSVKGGIRYPSYGRIPVK